nr:hypothetical protein [Vibrio splendidus]
MMKNINKHLSGLPDIAQYKNQPTSFGEWEVKHFPLSYVTGYFSQASNYGQGIALLRQNVAWMSITPMELESHVTCQHSAKGKVVIAGLGLGMITLSLLKKPSVKKLIVLEIDQSLIDSFSELLANDTKKLWLDNIESGRLEVIQADCMKPLSSEIKAKVCRPDYMWVDIWEFLGYSEALSMTSFVQKQINAKTIDYWGIELDLITAMSRISTGEDSITKKRSKFSDAVNGFPLPISAKLFNRKALAFYFELTMRAGYNVVKVQKSNKEDRQPLSAFAKK